jgi:chemotaxis protein MotB
MKFLILLLLIVSTTATQLSAQSKLQKLFWSKRYKRALLEIDRLTKENIQLKKDTTKLCFLNKTKDTTIASLQRALNDLNASYKLLYNSSDKKLAELTTSLQQQSSELDLKNKKIQEKDKRLKELEALLNRQDSILNALNSKVKNALLGFKSDELGVEMKNGKVYVSMSDKLLFKSGQATVEDKGKDAIKKLADVLIKNNDIDVAIEGHTDSIPIKTSVYKDNWDLSVARSTNIVRMLTEEFKVEAKRVTASGKGEFLPVASNSTPEGRAKNRRTEIVLSPKLEELFKLMSLSGSKK